MDFLIEKVIDAVLKASGLEDKVGRNEQVIRLKQRFGLNEVKALAKFEDIYAYALVEYAFDVEGRCKPGLLIAFFKEKAVRDVFRTAYRDNDPREWLEKGQAIAQYRLGDQLPEIDPRRELSMFAVTFIEVVKQTRSAKEIRQEQKIDSLAQQLVAVQAQIQQLPSLEAINQTVSQLAGKETAALPAAAQESNAAALAHRLGEWFEVLEYERVPDYEVWRQDYFEWAIDFPVTRRRVSRTLVRGVAGAVEMADLHRFAKAIEAAGADEGWLVGNRRVSKAARQAAADEGAYEEISCYTFDELIDEDADFSKYLDWLEADIKQRGVDVGYLPLACRKDELDPVSQRKIGVSTYGEEDGWIDGYVDMWLDDPAKEHLSVLGEFGTGKTWFALHYAWVALQRYRDAKRRGIERPRVPIVVPLRDYAKAVSVESLFSEFFFRKHEILKNYSVFEQLNRMGKLLLIFDGFDEMAARVDRQAMIDNFWELAKVVVPGAKAILTCRTEHFPDAIQGRQLLSAELESSTANLTGETPQFEVLDLEKFDDEQIATLLGQQASEATVRVVMENSQLLDLARRPVMVELILEALPEIEAGKPVDMARVYLYAVTKKMQRDISNERTFTSLADKLYFLCELSWEMLSTDQMSLNYRAFPARLKEMFADRVKDDKELDHWRYDMMSQTMLIRNSEGDYSPAHRSLLEFFVAYKIVASLGAMAVDFTEIAQQQSHVLENSHSQSYTWHRYFKRECDENGTPKAIAPIQQFDSESIEDLFPLLGQAKIAKAVLDLAYPMLGDDVVMQSRLLPLLQMTAAKTVKESGYIGGNVAQLMLARTPYALADTNLSGVNLQGVDFSEAFLRKVNLRGAYLADILCSKVLGIVYSLAYSPDQTHLAVGDNNGIFQIWNILTGQVILFCKGHTGTINSLIYSPDGQQLATASYDRTIKLWNAKSGDHVRTFEGHKSAVRSITYSPNGLQLATGSYDGTVKLWNPINGDCISTFEGHEDRVHAVAYSPDGEQLATGSYDGTVRLWSQRNGECTHILSDHKSWVRSIAYSPDGQQLATGSYDRTVKLWNLMSRECMYTLTGHEDGVLSVSYSPDGQQLAVGSVDRTVTLWNPMSGEHIRTLRGHEDWVRSVTYSSDGQQLATGGDDTTVKLWNPENGKCVRSLKGDKKWIRSIAYSPDGKQLVTGSYSNAVKIWNPMNGAYIRTIKEGGDWVDWVAYSPDGENLATGSYGEKVQFWNPKSGSLISTIQDSRNVIRSMAYSPDGTQLVTGGADRTAKLWNTINGECVCVLEGHKNLVLSVAYSPNGKQLATGSADRTVKLWDLVEGNCVFTIEGHDDWVRSVAYNPSGQQLATASADSTVKLWNPMTGEHLLTLQGHENRVLSVAYSPDGKQLATGSTDSTIKFWNSTNGNCIRTLKGHDNGVLFVVYSPDGHQLATSSYDNTIRLWDVTTGKCIRVIDDRECAGLDITDAIGLSAGQQTALKLMGAVDYGEA